MVFALRATIHKFVSWCTIPRTGLNFSHRPGTWQEKEREAEEDIKAGRVTGPFHKATDFMRGLK